MRVIISKNRCVLGRKMNDKQSDNLTNNNPNLEKKPLYISYAGPTLLNTPLLNKGSAFSQYERENFNLHGLLPDAIEDLDSQEKRAYRQFKTFISDMGKHIYLRNIQDTNETLFYKLISNHLEEMMPIIYTPVVGQACQQFSEIYRKARGLFLCYDDIEHLDDMMMNLTKLKVKVFVITDGERILGLGDQGIGGMGIPIGKLSLYTACGGISPAYTAPICLDVGTNNQNLLDDPFYMGKRHKRISDKHYFEFVDQVIETIYRYFPDALIQFEDFAAHKAKVLLDRYKEKFCCFNDDIQGTAAVTLATLISACRLNNQKVKDQKILFLGAGSAGVGIANQLIEYMMMEGLTKAEAQNQIYLLDISGLICETNKSSLKFQKPYERKDDLSKWSIKEKIPDILETVSHAKITTIIGVSGTRNIISKEIVEKMQEHTHRPIIFPLSNPTSNMEAHPRDLIEWTNGEVICSTGSPIEPMRYNNQLHRISQCNNSYIFPGIGLAVISAKIRKISDEMLMAAAITLANSAPKEQKTDDKFLPLLPELSDIHPISKEIAFAVAKCAMKQRFAKKMKDDKLRKVIEDNFWTPEYRNYRRYTT